MDLSYFISFQRKPIKAIRFFVRYILCLQNQSLLSSELNLVLWNWNYVSKLFKKQLRFETLFPESKLRFQNRSFDSGIKTLILGTTLRIWYGITICKWRFGSRKKASIPEMKLQFLKQSINCGNKDPMPETKLHIYKQSILEQTRKSTGFKSLRINCWEINQVSSKYQMNIRTKRPKKCLRQKKRLLPSNFTYSN